MTSNARWDEEVDVVVVGGGCGGMSAALACSILGLSVVLCEKTDQVGGTTSTSAGTIWIPLTKAALAGDQADSREQVERYLAGLIPNATISARLRAFLDAGPKMLDFFALHTAALRFLLVARHPDYRFDVPGATVGGRALIPPVFDGRLLGKDFDRVRPPIREFMPLGGMMVGKDDIAPLLHPLASVSAFRHACTLLFRYASDRLRYRRGTRLVMGNALVARLLHSLRQRQVPIRFEASLDELVMEQGRVIGLTVKQSDGPRTLRARKGVVLATGGFGGSAALRAQYLPQPPAEATAGFTGNTADAIRLAVKSGAAIDTNHVTPTFWVPVSVMKRSDGTTARYPHIVLDRAKPGLIAIDGTGKRFTNEADSYHDFVLAMYANYEQTQSLATHLICDARFLRDYGLGLIYPKTRDLDPYLAMGYLKCGKTLEDLAHAIAVDGSALVRTVARYNEHAARGDDPDFGKGASILNRHNGDPTVKPNPCVRPIGAGPYYAVSVFPSDLSTSVGLSADEHARVLDEKGAPLTGLYVCGADMSSVMQGAYPGPGTTLGPAMTFAYLAAHHLAALETSRDAELSNAVEAPPARLFAQVNG
ncbi:MAG: FAD-dependent oxidoreductase [Betaproteobacteria bacterium]|nr:FAD-dependent oxidoreductase [Betaproteobacteria bacterium]